MFKNPFSIKGRIRRLEFGLSYIVYWLALFLLSNLTEFLFQFSEYGGLFGFLLIVPVWFFIAQAVKRCHDRGNSGWYVIIPFYVLILIFAEGEIGENKYGPNPKGEGNKTEIDQIGAVDAE